MAALLILKVGLKLVELNSRFGIIILYRGVLVRFHRWSSQQTTLDSNRLI